MRLTKTLGFLLSFAAIPSYCAEETDTPTSINMTETTAQLSNEEIAKRAILMAYGQANEQLEQILLKQLDGSKKRNCVIPIYRLCDCKSKSQLKQLSAKISKNRQVSVSSLITAEQEISELSANIKPIFQWIIDSSLVENLEAKINLKNSNYWKYINGALTIAASLAVGLLEYYLKPSTTTTCTCDCSAYSNATAFMS
jgi:hypothetical protein